MGIKICLINPPHEESLDSRLDPPLGLMYLSSVLKKINGCKDVKIIDLSFYQKDKWKELITWADLYGITVMTASYHHALMIRDICRGINNSCKVMVGGAHPSALPFDTIKDFDIVVVGEGEGIMKDVVENVEGNGENKNNGEREGEGEIFFGNKKEINIDDIPYPDRDSLPIKEYTRLVNGEKATSILASRGCTYECSYCINSGKFRNKNGDGKKVRFRSVENVINELKLLKEKYGFKSFIFYDDTFTIHPNLDKLLEEIKKLDIVFRCNGNARIDRHSKFRSLYLAGCREIDFGIESGSQKILDKINKKVTVEKNRNAVLEAKIAGLIVKAFLMVGSPGESWDTIEETIKFMWETRPQLWTLFNFIPMPGCDIYDNPELYGCKILKKGMGDWKEYFNIAGQNEGGLVCDTEYMTAEDIEKARKYMIKKLPPQYGPLQKYYERLEIGDELDRIYENKYDHTCQQT